MAATFEVKTAVGILLAGDSSKTIISAPAANERIKVFRALYISNTSAAQALRLDIGSENVLSLAASITAHTPVDTGWLSGGITGQAGKALIASPAAAGPAGSFYIDYAIE